MHDRGTVIFSMVFCGIILSVPVTQVIVELARKERVQAADILADTFVTPVSRNRAIASDLRKIADSLKSGERLAARAFPDGRNGRSPDMVLPAGSTEMVPENVSAAREKLYILVEDVHAGLVGLRAKIIEKNRYVADSTASEIALLDSVLRVLEKCGESVDKGDGTAVRRAVGQMLSFLETIEAELGASGSPGIGIVIGAFFTNTFFSKRYLRGYEKELENRSFFELKVRPVVQLVRYALLGDPGTKALTGKNGWLFYRPGIEYLYRPSISDPRSRSVDYNDNPLHDDPVAVIVDFKKQLEARGIELMVVIVPGKGSVYPDLLSKSHSPPNTNFRGHSADVLKKIGEAGVMKVDLFGPLIRERANDPAAGDSVYLSRDSHWRSRGLRCAARTVADEIRKRPWYNDPHTIVEYAIDSVFVNRVGDVGTMTGLPDVAIRGLRLGFPPEVTKCYPVLRKAAGEMGDYGERVPYRDDFSGSRIMVLGDSFSRIYQTDDPRAAGWIAHLARELSEPLASIISDGGASTLVREKLARKPGMLKGKRIVIWEFVERDLRYGAYGWKKVSLASENR